MRRFLFTSTMFAVASVVACTTFAAEPWPQVNGPMSNFSPTAHDAAVVDDISKIRQVWLSEDADLGFGKGSVSGWLRHLATQQGHPGSCSAPILADGLVFAASFRPSGKPWAENQPQYLNYLKQPSKKSYSDEEKERMVQNLRILADDLLVATDMNTGKTVWKAIEPGAGLNRYMGKRQGYNVSPAYYDGAVFSLGTMGVLRAYSSKTGDKIWETPVEPAVEIATQAREQSLERKQLAGGLGWNVSLVVADGVLIVPLFDGADVGLRGVDCKTGKTRWRVDGACSRTATPAVWRHEGSEYVLCANSKGELRLIRPTDGKELWQVSGLGANLFSLTPSGDLVFVNAGTTTPRKPDDDEFHGALAAYRLSVDSATRIWKHPNEPLYFLPTWMDSCARRFLAVHHDRLFYYARNSDKQNAHLMMLDQATGKVLAQAPLVTPAPLFWPAGDKLLFIRDASHGDTALGLFTTDAKDFRQIGELFSPPHLQTTAYEVLMEQPIYQGRIYMRTQDGRIACYDLTKQ